VAAATRARACPLRELIDRGRRLLLGHWSSHFLFAPYDSPRNTKTGLCLLHISRLGPMLNFVTETAHNMGMLGIA
jgi:hypothetical protein